MKVCEKCGTEIGTKDGEGLCRDCETKRTKREEANRRRRAHDEALRSVGLVKVKGELGGTYWE